MIIRKARDTPYDPLLPSPFLRISPSRRDLSWLRATHHPLGVHTLPTHRE
jgi:hypothetical protein